MHILESSFSAAETERLITASAPAEEIDVDRNERGLVLRLRRVWRGSSHALLDVSVSPSPDGRAIIRCRARYTEVMFMGPIAAVSACVLVGLLGFFALGISGISFASLPVLVFSMHYVNARREEAGLAEFVRVATAARASAR